MVIVLSLMQQLEARKSWRMALPWFAFPDFLIVMMSPLLLLIGLIAIFGALSLAMVLGFPWKKVIERGRILLAKQVRRSN